MDAQPPLGSLIEYIGLLVLAAMLGIGVLAILVPDAWLTALVKAVLPD